MFFFIFFLLHIGWQNLLWDPLGARKSAVRPEWHEAGPEKKTRGFFLRQIEDQGKWLMFCWACFFFKLELRWWNSFTLQWWTLPRLFFFEILCPTLSPSTRLSWVVVLHTEALFLFGAGDPRKPLFCFMRVILVTVATEWLWDILRCR